MFEVIKNVRLNRITYKVGDKVEEIPDKNYKHCFRETKSKDGLHDNKPGKSGKRGKSAKNK